MDMQINLLIFLYCTLYCTVLCTVLYCTLYCTVPDLSKCFKGLLTSLISNNLISSEKAAWFHPSAV